MADKFVRALAHTTAGFLLLAIACAACGDAFTAAPDGGGPGGDAGTTPDAEPDATPPSDAGPDDAVAADAGAGFCASQAASHTFCEDFSNGVPGRKLAGVVNGGGMIAADKTDFQSAPASMLATTPGLPNKGDSANAIATVDFPTIAGNEFTLSMGVEPDASCMAGNNGDFVSFAALYFPGASYEIGIGVTDKGIEVIEASLDDGGAITGIQVHDPQVPLQPSGWANWTITTSGTISRTFTMTVGGQAVFTNERLKSVPATAPIQHPTLVVGAATRNTNGRSSGC